MKQMTIEEIGRAIKTDEYWNLTPGQIQLYMMYQNDKAEQLREEAEANRIAEERDDFEKVGEITDEEYEDAMDVLSRAEKDAGARKYVFALNILWFGTGRRTTAKEEAEAEKLIRSLNYHINDMFAEDLRYAEYHDREEEFYRAIIFEAADQLAWNFDLYEDEEIA